MPMTTERPKIQRAYVTIRDPDSKESTHVVLYNATVKEVEQRLKTEASSEHSSRRREKQVA